MRLQAALLPFTLAALVQSAAAADLPRAGNCESDGLMVPRVEWSGDEAQIYDHVSPIRGTVDGLREHSGGFKLSIHYEDDILGPSEIVIFSMDLGRGTEYRLGHVSYDALPDGSLVVGTISPFEEARCALLR